MIAPARATGRWNVWVTTTNRRRLNAAVRTAYGLDHRQARRRMRRAQMLQPRRLP